MRASLNTYQKVAENCSEYRRTAQPYAPVNSTRESEIPSCTNCAHFTNKEFCDLDLYDKIVENKL